MCRYTGHTLAKFIITIATGIITGTFAVLLGKFVGFMMEWKNEFIQHILEGEGSHRIWIAFLWHVAYSCFLVIFAVALVRHQPPSS
jgi:chloride channel 7